MRIMKIEMEKISEDEMSRQMKELLDLSMECDAMDDWEPYIKRVKELTPPDFIRRYAPAHVAMLLPDYIDSLTWARHQYFLHWAKEGIEKIMGKGFMDPPKKYEDWDKIDWEEYK